MNTKHTPGPWLVANKEDFSGPFAGMWEVYNAPFGLGIIGYTHTEANAARIVACVNACESIADPSVVPELLEALQIAQATLTNIYAGHLAPVGCSSEEERRKALRFWPNSPIGKMIAAAIAKATGTNS